MARYVQVRNPDGTFSYPERGRVERRGGPHWQVMPDIEDFVSPVDGTVVSGRAQRREHCEEHDMVDVGNDPAVLRPRPMPEPSGMMESMKRAWAELGGD